MITDIDAARLCQALYDEKNVFDYVGSINNVDYAFKDFGDCSAVIFEGSHTVADWKNDFDADMVCPPALAGAGVHHGFYNGLPLVMLQLKERLSKTRPIYCVGHSLGAGRAHIFAAMLVLEGYNVIVVAFGSPRPGDQKLANILAPIPIRSYWNYHSQLEHDLVGDVPVAITPLFRYVVPRQRILVDVPPAPSDAWGEIMGWHHIQYYVEGLTHG